MAGLLERTSPTVGFHNLLAEHDQNNPPKVGPDFGGSGLGLKEKLAAWPSLSGGVA